MARADLEHQMRQMSKGSSAPHESSEREWMKHNPDKRTLWPSNDEGKLAGFNQRSLTEAIQTYFLRWRGAKEDHPPPPPWYRSALAWLGTFLSLLLIGGMQQWMNMHWSIPLLLSAFGPSCALVFGLPTLPSSQPTNSIGRQPVQSAGLAFALTCIGATCCCSFIPGQIRFMYSNLVPADFAVVSIPNSIVGTVIGGVVGLFFRVLVGRQAWIAMALSVATAIAVQEVVSMQYPPGVTTTLLMVTLVPENSFQEITSNGALHTWCIRPLLEHGLLRRFTDGCRILLASMMGQIVILIVALLINNLHPSIGYPTRWL